MKKALAVLLAAVLLLPLLAACGEKSDTDRLLELWERDRAFALYELLMEHARAADAFSVTTEMDYEATLHGMDYRTSLTARDLCADQNGSALFELSEQTVRTVYGYSGLREQETEESVYVRGYADGYTFRSQTYGGMTTARKTALTPDAYRDCYGCRADGIMIPLNYWSCANVTCRQLSDGSWEARFGGFDQNALDGLRAMYGVDFSALSEYVYLSAAEVTVLATPELEFQTIYIALDYAEPDGSGSGASALPTVRYALRFGEWNTAQRESVALSDYTDVGDLRVLDTALSALHARKTADRGDYTLHHDQTVTTDGEARTRTYGLGISFDTAEGAFTLAVDGSYRDYDGSTDASSFVYRNGTASENGMESAMTEAEARAVLASHVAIPEFYEDDVIRIEELDPNGGRYRLRLGARMEQRYRETYGDAGWELTVFESYLEITLRDGVLDAYTYVLHTGGRTGDGKVQDNRVERTCRFSGASNPSESPAGMSSGL